MQCPHCSIAFNTGHASTTIHREDLGKDVDGAWSIQRVLCPTCQKCILTLIKTKGVVSMGRGPHLQETHRLIRPAGATRLCPKEVPAPIAEAFQEATEVLPVSAKASAALSRRCLQTVIHTAANIKRATLDQEIQALLDTNGLPSHLATDVDAIRNIGNFGAHPIKSTNTGEIVDVEPNEAEWNLDVLEGLFDFYYVQPDVSKKRREALNAKLADAGKKPIKSAP